MSDQIFFDGVRYISAHESSEISGLTRDYIARLCREGKVRGRQVGRNWYLDHRTLLSFLVSQEYARTVRKESLTEYRKREYHGPEFHAEEMSSAAVVSKSKHDAQAVTAVSALTPESFYIGGVGKNSRRPAVSMGYSATAVSTEQSNAIHHSLASAVVRGVVATPSGVADAALRLAHIPTHTLTPLAEFLHKVVALTLALMLTFGTYALVDPQYARFAARSISDTAHSIAASFDHVGTITEGAQTQLAAAAENPAETLALATYTLTNTLPRSLASLASALNVHVNTWVYAVAFPMSVTSSTGAVAVNVQPYSNGAKSDIRVEPTTVRPADNSTTPRPIATRITLPTDAASSAYVAPSPTIAGASTPATARQPVIEPTAETQPASSAPVARVVVAGGITQDELTAQLSALDNKLSSKMYSLASAQSTVTSQNYSVTAQTNAIDQLDNTTITNPTITGGTIAGTDISAKSLSVSGGTTLSDITVSGDLILGGSLVFSGSSSTISAMGATFLNATSTNFAVTGATTLANTTINGDISVTGSLLFPGSSTTISAAGGTFTYGTSTNFVATNASIASLVTMNATSTNFFSTLAHFTSGIVDTLSSTFATITDLSATDLVATNSTTTNATTTNAYIASANIATASTTNLTFATAVGGNATTSNSFATTASSTNLFSTNGTVGALTAGTLSLTAGTSTNFFSTTASSTNLFSTNLNAGTATLGNATTTTLFSTTASSTNLFATTANFGALSANGFTANGSGYFSGGLGIGVATSSPGVLQTSSNAWIGGNLFVGGNSTVIGNSTSNTITINSAVNSNVVPNGNKIFDLGSPSYYWRNIYVDTLTTNFISAASSSIGGTNSQTFTLNAANNTADTEDMSLIFFRGTVVPNGVISWNSAANAKRFEFNQAIYVSNQSGSTTQPTFTLRGISGQTGNIFQIASSSGATLFAVGPNGETTIGGSLTVNGNLTSTMQASTTLFSSSGPAYFGTTATTTIDQAGNISGPGTLSMGTTTLQSLAVTNTSTSTFAGPVTFGTNLLNITSTGQIGIGTGAPNTSAKVQIDSTSQGFLPPRLTSAQKNAIASPAPGLVVFDTDLNKLNVWNGSVWKNVGSTEIAGEVTNGTTNSVLFVDAGTLGPVLAQDNASFNYASSTHTLTLAKLSLTAGTTTNLNAGFVTLGSATTTNLFSTTASSTNLFSQTATLGTLNTGSLTLGSALSVLSGGTNATTQTTNGVTYFDGTRITSGTSLTFNGTTFGTPLLNTTQSSGTSTIASGQGFTIGGSQFVAQQGSGNVGINVASPAYKLDVAGDINIGAGSALKQGGVTSLVTSGASTFNTLVGQGAGTAALLGGGTSNTALGYGSLAIASSTQQNTAVGAGALAAAGNSSGTEGNGNTALGYNSLSTVTGGTYNLGLGVATFNNLTSGSNNIGLGYQAGANLTSGSNNIVVGYNISVPLPTGSNQLNIGNLIFGTGLDGTFGSLSSGNVGIGTTTPATPLDVNGVVTSEINSGIGYNGGFMARNYGVTGSNSVQMFQAGSSGAANGWINNAGVIEGQASGGLLLSSYNNSQGINFQTNLRNTAMTILSTGNVGIGTTSPTHLLQVQGASLMGNSNIWLDPTYTNGGASRAAQIVLAPNDNGGTPVQATIQSILLNGNAGAGATALAFSTESGGAAPTEKMRIDNSGNVGIGTVSPSYLLDVQKDGASNYTLLRLGNTDVGGAGSNMVFSGNGNVAGEINSYFSGAWTLSLGTDSHLNTLNLQNGNVGIGTASPTMPLDVNGNIRIRSASGTYFYNGNNDNYAHINGGSASDNALVFATNAEAMRITTAGNVGIGTTTPVALLNVSGGDTSVGFQMFNNAVNLPSFEMGQGLVSGNSTPYFRTLRTSSDDNSSLRFFVKGAALSTTPAMEIRYDGNVGIGMTPTNVLDITRNQSGAAVISLLNNASGSSNSALYLDNGSSKGIISQTGTGWSGAYFTGGPTTAQQMDIGTQASAPLVFATTNTSRMVIDSSGNVGIGTTTPNNKTTIYSATKSALEFSGAAAGSWTMGYDVSNGRFSIASSTALGTTDRFVINSTGNVGIGTTSPATTLSVTGNGYLTGGLGVGLLNTAAGTINASGGSLTLSNGTSNTIFFGAGLAVPGNGSLGEKMQLYGATPGTVLGVDYAIGVEANNVWFNAPAGGGMKWYSGSVFQASINGSGQMLLGGATPYSGSTNDLNLTKNGSLAAAPGIDFSGTIASGADSTSAYSAGRIYSVFTGTTYSSARLTLAYPTAENTYADGLSLINGNVGIGTAAPTSLLQIGSIAGNNIGINSSGTITHTYTPNSVNDHRYILSSNGNGDFGLPAAYNAGALGFGTGGLTDSVISGGGGGFHGGAGNLQFFTGANVTTPRVIFDENGNVGIGTTAPTASLQIGPFTASTLYLLGNANTTTQLIKLSDSGTNWGFDMANVANGVTSDFQIIRHSNSSAGTVAMDINRDTGATTINGALTSTAYTVSSSTPGGLGGYATISNPYDGNYGSTYSALFLDVIGGSSHKTGIAKVTTGSFGVGDMYFLQNSVADLSSVALTDAKMVIKSSGNVGIGTTGPTHLLEVNGTVAFTALSTGAGNGALCMSTAGVVTYDAGANCIVSSQRFKNSIAPLGASDSLVEVMALNPVSFRYNAGVGDGGAQQQVGFIAEQVNTVDPRLVVFDASSTPYSVKYQNLTALLAGAIQAQQGEFDALTGAASSTASMTPQAQSFASAFFSNLFTQVTAWLGNPSNGIGNLFAKNIYATNGTFTTVTASSTVSDTVTAATTTTNVLCVGATCVTPEQFQTIDATASSTPASFAAVTLSIQDQQAEFDALTGSTTASTTPQAASFVSAFFSNLFGKVTAWLADAGNGIGDVFARTFHAKSEICIGGTCVTEPQLKGLLALQNGSSTASVASVSVAASTGSVPVLAIQGNNPATISVGAVYADLGATITGPTTADTNLGIRTFVDGVLEATVQIDTATSSTHTIDYVATNSFGTATSTRTVIVAADVAGGSASSTASTSTTDTSAATSTTTTDSTSSTTSTAATTTDTTTATSTTP